MLLLRTIQFRLELTGAQEQICAQFAGAGRWVWNKALENQLRLIELGLHTASYREMCHWLTEWRHDPTTSWLADSPAQAQQHRLKDLDRAIQDYFRPADDPAKKDFPTFRKKYQCSSFRYPSHARVALRSDGWGYVYLPKIGWVRFRATRAVIDEICQVTVLYKQGHWFVSIQTERTVPDPQPTFHAPVGIDLGIANFAVLSDDTPPIEPLNARRSIAKRLNRAKRSLDRKHLKSANWIKQKKRVAKLEHYVANARRDFLHKHSTAIAKNHGVVVLEDLSVERMTKSAKGTQEHPGKNVQAKSNLNRAILDQGWCTFRTMLDYKLTERGGMLVLVDPRNTSRTCPCCGYVSADNRQTQARFKCAACGYEAHADKVGAGNILERGLERLQAAGHAVSACGGQGQRPPYDAGTHGKIVQAISPGISGL